MTALQQAWDAFRQGRFDEAIGLGEQELRAQPESQEALLLLGVAHVRKGNLDGGIAALKQLVAINPAQFDGWNWLSMAHSRKGDHEGAVESAKRALQLNPNSADALSNLGVGYFGLERFGEAESAFGRAFRLDPRADGHVYNLGRALAAQGKSMEAYAAFEQAGRLARSPYAALKQQIMLMQGMEKWAEARLLAKHFVRLFPEDAFGYGVQGGAEIQLGNRDGLTLFEKAAELDRTPERLFQVATAAQFLGDFAKAEPLLREIVAGDSPATAPALLALVNNGFAFQNHTDLVARAEALLQSGSLPAASAVSVHFALGKAYDQADQLPEAMAHFNEGNALAFAANERTRTFSATEYRKGILQLPNDYLRLNALLGDAGRDQGEGLVFVVGMIRSGTTLMHQILTADSDLVGAGELGFFYEDGRMLSEAFTQQVTSDLLNAAREGYLAKIALIRKGARFAVDKFPGNCLSLGLMHLAFPKAKILHMTRNPVDTCLSIWMTPNSAEHSWGNNRANVATAYRVYRELMAAWGKVLPPESLLDVAYEDLVREPETTTKAVAAFLEIDWSPNFLRHTENKGAVYTPSVWQVRQPLYTSSIGRGARYERWLPEFLELT